VGGACSRIDAANQKDGAMTDPFHVPTGVRAGDILIGKYRVERVLGFGGMGVVVAAHHLGLDQRVALKFLVPEAFSDPQAIVRFDREARAAAKIKSQHVARVTDVGTLDNGAPYMVIEYLEGEDLAACLQREGAFPIGEAVRLVLQACEAIDEAHRLGIVHRDLKPANLFCIRQSDGSRSIKVLDFGISKLTPLATTTRGMDITRAGAVMGSPLYMSPEQMQSPHTVDERTDIWGIGVLLYELLSGDVPFKGVTMPEICLGVTTRPPLPIRRVRPDTPPVLERVILRCLEKDRSRRFSNVAELASALAPFASARAPVDVRAARQSSSAGLSVTTVTVIPPGPVARSTSRSRTDASWEGSKQRFADSRRSRNLGRNAAVSALAIAAAAGLWSKRESVLTSMAISSSRPLEIASPASTIATFAEPTNAPSGLPSSIVPLVSPSAAGPGPRAHAEPPMPTSVLLVAPALATRSAPKSVARPAAPVEYNAPPGPLASAAPIAPRADERSTAARAPNCTLNFTSMPPCAVALDGVPLGTTPLLGISTSSGSHAVTFTHSEQGTKVMTVSCRPDEVKQVAVRLGARPLLEAIEPNPSK
jgi:serine/threonine protein kinase